MKIVAISAVCAAVLLSGCATQDQKAFYRDIQGCNRAYKGSVTLGGLQVGGVVMAADVGCEPLEITKAKATAIKAESDAKVEAIKAGAATPQ